MYKSIVTILFNLLIVSCLHAQDVPYSSDYILNPFTQNAARAGNNDVLNMSGVSRAFISYRNFWLGTSRPTGMAVGSFDTRVNSGNIGLGVIAFNHNSVFINRSGVGLAYAYHFKLGDDTKTVNQVSLGIQANYLNQHIDLRGSEVKHINDPQLVNTLWNGNYFDFDIGVTWRFFDFSIDLSGSNLLSWKKGVNPMYKEGVGFRPNFFSCIKYTKKMQLGTTSRSLTFEPLLSVYGQPNYVTNIDLGHSLLYSNSKIDFIISWALQFQSRGPEDISTPIGFYSSIGIGMSSQWKLVILHETNVSSVVNPGNTIGVQATYVFPNKERQEKSTNSLLNNS